MADKTFFRELAEKHGISKLCACHVHTIYQYDGGTAGLKRALAAPYPSTGKQTVELIKLALTILEPGWQPHSEEFLRGWEACARVHGLAQLTP